MQLVTNDGAGHRAAIRDVFKSANEALIAVAFLKKGGATFLCGELRERLKAGASARVFIGTDFYLTEPDALQTLLDLADEYDSLEVFLGVRGAATFHPKTYVGFGPHSLRCLVGSANLTGGALGANTEISLRADAADPSPIADQFRQLAEAFEAGGRFEILTAQALEVYRSVWKPVDRARKQLDDVMETTQPDPIDLDVLGRLYRAYQRDKKAQAELAMRGPARKEARAVQRKIAGLRDAELTSETRARLAHWLQDLMSGNGGRHLWPSDNIFRTAGAGLSHPRKLIALFDEGERAAKLPPVAGYAAVREIATSIPGIGINLTTELMSTYAPKRFAVVNNNTVGALARLGLTFKGSSDLSVRAITPERYATILGLIASVRDRIGAAGFPETDAFLNWIFHKKVRRAR